MWQPTVVGLLPKKHPTMATYLTAATTINNTFVLVVVVYYILL